LRFQGQSKCGNATEPRDKGGRLGKSFLFFLTATEFSFNFLSLYSLCPQFGLPASWVGANLFEGLAGKGEVGERGVGKEQNSQGA
jgi:hypothetical protein